MNKANSAIKYIGWFIATFFVYFQFLIQTSASVMQNQWAQYFHLDSLGVGLLSASFFYTYLFFQIPVGIIYDRFNTKKVLAIASFGLGVGCVLFASTKNYDLAIFSRMLMGGCAAFGFIGMLKVTSDYFPGRQFSLMMGFSEAFAAIATMFGVMLLVWAMSHTTWRMLMIYFSVGVFLITIAVLVFIQSESPCEANKIKLSELPKKIVSAMTNSTVLITGLYGFFMFSVVNSFNSLWGLAFLTHAYPINNELAAKIMSTVFLGLAVGCPLNGYFSKHYGHEREAMLACSFICALCMAIIIFVNVPISMLCALFFIVGLMCSVYVQAFAIVGQSVPSNIQATSMSVTNMLIMSSAPVFQILVGAMLDSNSLNYAHNTHQNYQYSLGILPIGMMIAFALCFFMKRENNA
jgi:MFS family permease